MYSKRVSLPRGGMLGVGMQMLCGGALLVILGVLVGEPAQLDPGAVSARSWLALLYLIVFGSIIGYGAFMWLLQVVSAARVATYAYVNPLVAVMLGWAFAGEALTLRMMVAAGIIVLGVAVITSGRR
jgi:drug/metabolite transporter (DMT)-like permease